MVKPLWNHQIEAIKIAERSTNLFLAMEMGTGKTRTTIEIVRRRFAKEGRMMKTLIISPILVCENWKREWAMFSKIQPHDVVVLNKSGARRKKKFIDTVGDTLERNKIIITNYQSLLMKDLFKLVQDWGPEIIIFDESHKLKNPSASTSKQAVILADKARYKFLLTGTPILNSPMDLWMQYRILDGGRTFGQNFYAFRAMYFCDENAAWSKKPGHFSKWVPTPDTFDRIQDKIKGSMFRALKKDCLDLPPLVRQEYYVELSEEQAKMYRDMRDEYLAFVESIKADHPITVTAQLAITKALRLQQIVSGYAATEQAGIVWVRDNPRINALEELLEEITPNHKVIVWAVFHENYKMIRELCEKMNLKYAEVHGGIKNPVEQMDKFQKEEDCRVMIANQASGGTGVNLTQASYSIYYSKGFKWGDDEQSESRNHRGGSEIHKKITRIDLVAKDTIDELVNEALLNKKQVSDLILNWSI